MFKEVNSKPNFPKLEEEILEFWEDNKIFEKSLAKNRDLSPNLSPSPGERGKKEFPSPGDGEGERERSKNTFTFYDGPPFATGLPHYGHILASTIKDLIPRYQTMKGRYVPRRWGWDCHGLPIEEIVERELKISGKKEIEKIGIKKFNETCRSMVLMYVKEWGKMVRRIARWTEFDNSYKTMDRDYMESVWWAFKQIYEKGLVYEGRKVLLYCPRCETPISNFEVAMDDSYKDVTEEAVIVKFSARGGSALGGKIPNDKPTFLLAWTTTPWTLPGNAALYVGKDIEYVVVRITNHESRITENYIVAKDRAVSVIPDLIGDPDLPSTAIGGLDSRLRGNDKVIVVDTFKGRDLVGLEYEPLFDVPAFRHGVIATPTRGRGKQSHGEIAGSSPDPDRRTPRNDKVYKVYPADFVNTEEGTGIVHSAVVHGEEDYEYGLREGLPVVPLLDEKGQYNEKAPKLLQGQYFKTAEKDIKADLEKRGLLFQREMHTHSYPHCWRCENVLFYSAIPAWFINISKIKKQILKSNKKEINWYPAHLKFGRYAKSVEQAPDWNISRNRYWGNPMPVWKCTECKKETVIGSVAELKEKAIDNRLSIIDNNFDLHRPYIDEVILKCEHPSSRADKPVLDHDRGSARYGARCGGEARRITEIFDSWVEAASMPFASVHWPFEPSSGLRPPSPEQGEGQPSSVRLRRTPSPEQGEGQPSPRGGRGQGEGVEFPFPAQFVTEYIAQTRAWFYVMHVISLILFKRAPFENVLTTGTIMAEDWSKLSKSKRNFPDPWEVIDKYGVDSLRFYLMNSVVMQADNMNFSLRDLENVNRKVIRILWNVYNYFVTYANEASSVIARTPTQGRGTKQSPGRGIAAPRQDVGARNDSGILDQWILARLQELVNKVAEYLDNYDTVHATREIEVFINDLSTWYLRRSRGRSDEGFFATLHHCLVELSKLIAPFMPFLSEAIYRNLVSKGDSNDANQHSNDSNNWNGIRKLESLSVHLADWPRSKKLTKKQQEMLGQMQEIRKIAAEVHALRAKAGIKLRQKLGKLTIPSSVFASASEAIPKNGEIAASSPDPDRGTPRNDKLSDLLDILKAEVNVAVVELGDKLELDTTITPELKLEGLARELERQIQQLRKDSGFKIGELADLYYETKSDMIEEAMKLVDREKIYVRNTESRIMNHESREEIEKEIELEIEGNNVKFQITNVKSNPKSK